MVYSCMFLRQHLSCCFAAVGVGIWWFVRQCQWWVIEWWLFAWAVVLLVFLLDDKGAWLFLPVVGFPMLCLYGFS